MRLLSVINIFEYDRFTSWHDDPIA